MIAASIQLTLRGSVSTSSSAPCTEMSSRSLFTMWWRSTFSARLPSRVMNSRESQAASAGTSEDDPSSRAKAAAAPVSTRMPPGPQLCSIMCRLSESQSPTHVRVGGCQGSAASSLYTSANVPSAAASIRSTSPELRFPFTPMTDAGPAIGESRVRATAM